MKIRFSLDKAKFSGETCGNRSTVYLWHCYSPNDVLECIKHEELHAVLNETEKTTAKEDHYIMKVIWFS